MSLGQEHNSVLLSFDLQRFCCPVGTMMSLLLGNWPTTGDMQTDGKSKLQLCGRSDVTLSNDKNKNSYICCTFKYTLETTNRWAQNWEKSHKGENTLHTSIDSYAEEWYVTMASLLCLPAWLEKK